MKAGGANVAFLMERGLGDTFAYHHRNDQAVTLYGTASGIEGGGATVLNVRSSLNTRKFWASKQTSFPPTDGPVEGDRIVYRGETWTVSRGGVKNEDGIGERFEFECSFTKGLSVQI